MVYDPNIPQPTDDLDESQQDILDNFTQLDVSFLVDHYTFSDLTANNGKHKTVTTPNQSSHPTTAAAEPKLYANQDYASLGVLQYSRGPSDAVPCPVTHIQSASTAVSINGGSFIAIFDFTGIGRAMATLYAANFVSPTVAYAIATCFWNGTTLTVVSQSSATLSGAASGTILRLQNSGLAVNNVYWTLKLHRIQ